MMKPIKFFTIISLVAAIGYPIANSLDNKIEAYNVEQSNLPDRYFIIVDVTDYDYHTKEKTFKSMEIEINQDLYDSVQTGYINPKSPFAQRLHGYGFKDILSVAIRMKNIKK